jgi:signal transduction histidine kinase
MTDQSLEEQLRAAQAELRQAQEAAVQALAAAAQASAERDAARAALAAVEEQKAEFVSFVAHELKNPMASMLGYADLLGAGLVGPLNEQQTQFVKIIRGNTERMRVLVSNLADVSRVESGRLQLHPVPVDVEDVADEITRTCEKDLKSKQQTLSVEVAPGLSKAYVDRGRLIQVLNLLLSNAHKYSSEGAQIVLRAAAGENGALRLSVEDHGVGIAPEDQAHLFEKFWRSEDAAVRESPGNGLGLLLAKYLVEAQGGRIWCESVFRQGTTFHFTAPASSATS